MEIEEGNSQLTMQNPSDGGRRRPPPPTTTRNKEEEEEEAKPKVIVIMGPTGSGKSKLAIDLAAHFPIEIINADSMQVYHGLDVLTNKVPLHQQNGVPHHLLGTISPNVEFTAKDFRDFAIPLINDILSRNCLPVIVGGTNYYIQALVSPFLLDDTTEDLDETLENEHLGDEQNDHTLEFGRNDFDKYLYLKELDPVAANRVHPHDSRKINQYLTLYARSGILPSKLYQGKAAENWGRIDNCRFDYCFICIDAAIPVLDQYVGQRVDSMIDAGLLSEVCDIFNPQAVYTRGLRQAIGVREFEGFLKLRLLQSTDKGRDSSNETCEIVSANNDKMVKGNVREILFCSDDDELKNVLVEAIEKVKLNTRRLVRRQKRRLSRLRTLFGWNMQHVDATESISRKSDESWAAQVVRPAVAIVTSFLQGDLSSLPDSMVSDGVGKKLTERNLWTQYVCKACSNRVLRGVHEWEQHKQGRSHRKRVSSIRKSQGVNPLAVPDG